MYILLSICSVQMLFTFSAVAKFAQARPRFDFMTTWLLLFTTLLPYLPFATVQAEPCQLWPRVDWLLRGDCSGGRGFLCFGCCEDCEDVWMCASMCASMSDRLTFVGFGLQFSLIHFAAIGNLRASCWDTGVRYILPQTIDIMMAAYVLPCPFFSKDLKRYANILRLLRLVRVARSSSRWQSSQTPASKGSPWSMSDQLRAPWVCQFSLAGL